MDPPDRQVGYAVALFGSRQPTCQRKVLAAYARRNLVRSISRSGNVGGNAALERFFSLKADALSGKRIAPEARLAQMRPITSSNSTMRSGVRLEGSSERSHNERFWNGRLWRKAAVRRHRLGRSPAWVVVRSDQCSCLWATGISHITIP
jgi:hypothetical protein